MRLRWPPKPLGLGTPLNLALPSPAARTLLLRSWWLPLAVGLAFPLLMLAVDRLFFAGASLERLRELGAEPLPYRLLVVIYSGVTEELIYRLGIATVAAWVAWLLLSRFASNPKVLSQWIGIAIAGVLFGLAHVGNLPDVDHPVLRAVTVNGLAAIALGWLYWWRGLEAAILAHMVGIVVLYIAVPPLL